MIMRKEKSNIIIINNPIKIRVGRPRDGIIIMYGNETKINFYKICKRHERETSVQKPTEKPRVRESNEAVHHLHHNNSVWA